MSDERARSHDDLRADLPEYVMGILDGRARAQLQVHVESCDECASTIRGLTTASESLLHVAMGVEPPAGFESRVLAQIGALELTPRATRRRGATLIAVAVLVVVSVGAGWILSRVASPSTANASSGHVEQGALRASGEDVGYVYAYSGTPAWMFVSVKAASSLSSVHCLVVTKSGQHRDLGTFQLSHGVGSWGTPLPVKFSAIRSVELTSASGATVARLSTSNWTTSTTDWSH